MSKSAKHKPGTSSEPASVARVNGKFAPGHSGNPAGRPKITPDEIALLDRIRSLSDKAVAALEAVLDDAKAPADAKIKAANIVIERQLGKPRQELDQHVTNHQAKPSDHRPDLSGIRQRIIDHDEFERWKAERDAAAIQPPECEQSEQPTPVGLKAVS
jgi:hypothetical protein